MMQASLFGAYERWSRSGAVDFVGAMRPLAGAAPFAAAGLVGREREAPHRIVQLVRYDGGEIVGEPLTPEDWRSLCDAGHAHAFAEPVAGEAGASLWVLRRNFDGREAAVAELRAAGAAIAEMDDGWTRVLVVRESKANPIRDNWAHRAHERALAAAEQGQWQRSLPLAEQAYAVGRGPIAPHWALLALCYAMRGRSKRADGLVQVARRSHGQGFAAEVVEAWGRLARELCRDASRDLGAGERLVGDGAAKTRGRS